MTLIPTGTVFCTATATFTGTAGFGLGFSFSDEHAGKSINAKTAAHNINFPAKNFILSYDINIHLSFITPEISPRTSNLEPRTSNLQPSTCL
jgi:hypothetical protein